MSTHFPALLAIAMCLELTAASPLEDSRDYAKEALVIQSMTTEVAFSQDGVREWRQTLSVRVQSEGMLRQLGVLSFPYSAANEEIKVEYVRVKKADGTVVATPDSSIVDTTAEIATSAPTYSDLRKKQVPVKALGVGDVLEYAVESSQRKPEVQGQFWYEQIFPDDAVVLSESLEVKVPKEKTLQVSSPRLKYETHDNGSQRVYLWKYSQLVPSKPPDNQKQREEVEPLRVRFTTFKNWEEVGNWWGTLAAPEAAVTPAIQEKAKELTAGLSTDRDKARAIYAYVSMKFRYISISFGGGRYRPHTAEEVLTNQYGDCKDKHTLFTALLKAVGIQAWPALIGVGGKLDSSVPSPSQFNHVITVLPEDGKYVWVDTTQEVAPFGLLSQATRDEEALVISASGKPFLMKTPLDPPFRTSETIDVKSSLGDDGTLTGHFDIRMSGDSATALRSAFRQLAPAQWQALAQQMSFALNFGGEVSGVELENLDEPDKALHYSYEYTRKKYSDWENARITPPLPPLGFGPGDEADKPKEPFWVGSPGDVTYRGSVVMPKGFFVEPLQNVSLTSEFADYSASYSFKDGTLFTERKMTVKKAKVALDQWADYQVFAKGVRTDQAQFIAVQKEDEKSAAAMDDNPQARELLQRAANAVYAQKLNQARDLLRQAEQINPKQAKLWQVYGFLEAASGNYGQAITDLRKELSFHPNETGIYDLMTGVFLKAGRDDEAIELWKGLLKKNPGDIKAAIAASHLLLQAKRYVELITLLETSVAAEPANSSLQVMRIEALLRSGRKDEGIAAAQKAAKAASEPLTLNDLAFVLSDTDSDLGLAKSWAEKAVAQIEAESSKSSLAGVGKEELVRVTVLAAAWDTLGWTYYKQDNPAQAEKYIRASWQLSHHADVADHLGQLFEKQGKRDAAIHMWRLALAVNGLDKDAQERLRKVGARPVSLAEELNKLRTFKVPGLAKQDGIAEFFLLVSKDGIDDVRFDSGVDSLRSAGPAIRAANYKFPFPDDGAEKIIRRGMLSCSAYTVPSCQFALFLPSDLTMQRSPSPAPTAKETETAGGPAPPVPVTKTTTESDPTELVEEARAAAETAHDYNKTLRLTQQANAIWERNGSKPPEYAESLVWLSLAKLADSYQSDGSMNTSQWRLESADLLATAVDVCSANPAAKPEVLALALELQSLQANDKETSKKLRDRAGEIRGRLTREILPSPVRTNPPVDAQSNGQGEVQAPTLVKRVEPAYPEPAREARISGTVHLAFVVEADGAPSSVYLIEGLGFGLDEEAAKAVKQWRFNPGTTGGKAVRVQVRAEVTFKLL